MLLLLFWWYGVSSELQPRGSSTTMVSRASSAHKAWYSFPRYSHHAYIRITVLVPPAFHVREAEVLFWIQHTNLLTFTSALCILFILVAFVSVFQWIELWVTEQWLIDRLYASKPQIFLPFMSCLTSNFRSLFKPPGFAYGRLNMPVAVFCIAGRRACALEDLELVQSSRPGL